MIINVLSFSVTTQDTASRINSPVMEHVTALTGLMNSTAVSMLSLGISVTPTLCVLVVVVITRTIFTVLSS